MAASLTITAGPDAGRTCELLPGRVLLVGRGTSCDLQLSDPGVSRQHCRVIAVDDGYRLEDADSRFGTLVNQRPVTAQWLASGDTIALGDTQLRFEGDAALALTIAPRREVPEALDWLPDESVTYEGNEPSPDRIHDFIPESLIGSTYVRYQIDTIVARTSSGVTCRAVDSQTARVMAVKIFWPQLFSDEVAMSRFLRSMRAMVPLRHPHLVKLQAAGRSRGLCFTACEFIEGETALQLIDRIGIAGMLDWRTTWRIAIGVARALQFLHDAGLLHRGLHPGNIFSGGTDGCVRLGDSLLAKSLDELGQQALTARGDLVGDLQYLAPEQVAGETVIDCRADLYSLGSVLYALLTGKPPFCGAPADLIRQIHAASPRPPKAVHLSIPAAFESIVLRLLAKRPDDRFPTAAALVAELERQGRYEGLL